MRVRTILSVGVAVFFGLLTVAGYFIPFKPLVDLSGGLLYVAVFLSSIALLVGVINLSRIHLRKAASGKVGGGYSLVLFISLWVTFLVVFYAIIQRNDVVNIWIVRNIQLPLEASLSALVVFALLVGGVRLLYRRRDAVAFCFSGRGAHRIVRRHPAAVAARGLASRTGLLPPDAGFHFPLGGQRRRQGNPPGHGAGRRGHRAAHPDGIGPAL